VRWRELIAARRDEGSSEVTAAVKHRSRKYEREKKRTVEKKWNSARQNFFFNLNH